MGSSRCSGPERYLVAFGFREGKETDKIRSALWQSHNLGGGSSPLTVPLLSPIVSTENLLRDNAFAHSATEMSRRLCERQAKALEAVVSRAGFLENMAMSVSDATDEVPAAVPAEPSVAKAVIATVPRPVMPQ